MYTQDKETVIIYKDNNIVIYYNYMDEKSWVIYGKCDNSGSCVDRTFYLDCPVTPDLKCKCGLKGEWL